MLLFIWITTIVFSTVFVANKSEKPDAPERAYPLQPLGGVFGAEVYDISITDLLKNPDKNIINQINEDVNEYSAVIFRNQKLLSGDEHVNLTNWFRGNINCIHDDHPESPHRCVVRFANDPKLGLHGRGKKWHIDGGQRVVVDDIVIYQMASVAKEGKTIFLPLKECVELLTPQQREKFERLWYTTITGDTFPYMIVHPFTGNVIFRPHYYNLKAFVWDYGTDYERTTRDRGEKDIILREMVDHFEKTCRSLWYEHEWKKGDVVVTDNMALGHRASVEAYKKPSLIGPRILHRTSTLSSRIGQPLRGPKIVDKNQTDSINKDTKLKDEL